MHTISTQARLFVQAVIAIASLSIVLSADQIAWKDWPELTLFFAMMIVASSVRIPDPRGRSVTPTTVLCYLAMYLLNPPSALLVIGAGRAIGYSLSKGWVPWRALFNGAQMALSVALAAVVYRTLGGVTGDVSASSKIALLGAPVIHQVANNFFVAFGLSRLRGTPFLNTWYTGVLDLFWQNLLSVPTAIVFSFVYVKIHQSGILVYLVLLPLQGYALHLYIKKRQLYAQIVDGLVVATDVNFPMGRGHARRVADLSVAIAREMRLGEIEIEAIEFAALLHDVGLIGKDDLLDKPTLSAEDIDDLRDHVRIGAEIASELPRKDIAKLILCHHERYDGTGYPSGLSGAAIPLGARILAVAEIADSMATGIFPYSAPSTMEAIVSHVVSEKGRAFDPVVVDAFVRIRQRAVVEPTLTAEVERTSVVAPVVGGFQPR